MSIQKHLAQYWLSINRIDEINIKMQHAKDMKTEKLLLEQLDSANEMKAESARALHENRNEIINIWRGKYAKAAS